MILESQKQALSPQEKKAFDQFFPGIPLALAQKMLRKWKLRFKNVEPEPLIGGVAALMFPVANQNWITKDKEGDRYSANDRL